ncbi:hypothetical protein BD414DRAFT_484556 [Trametes punicea]|nr:hypothetical protein BD414DRAFT_484556 [Trametes punicea]
MLRGTGIASRTRDIRSEMSPRTQHNARSRQSKEVLYIRYLKTIAPEPSLASHRQASHTRTLRLSRSDPGNGHSPGSPNRWDARFLGCTVAYGYSEGVTFSPLQRHSFIGPEGHSPLQRHSFIGPEGHSPLQRHSFIGLHNQQKTNRTVDHAKTVTSKV